MILTELTSKDQSLYDLFVQHHPLGSIHQSWNWGVFQSKSTERDKFWVVVVKDDKDNIQASALIIRQRLPLGKCWLYCPRGPLVDYTDHQQLAALFEKIREIAWREKAIFVRFDPGIMLDSERENIRQIQQNLKTLKAKEAHAHYQPEHTLIVDLDKSEEEILKQMKPKGRYNIKVAQKHGVSIRISDEKSPTRQMDIQKFYDLLKATTSRDGFSGHPMSYYQHMLDVLGNQHALLYLAEYQSQVIAGMIVTYFNNTAIYYFGASGNEYRHVMAPYLLQWQAMQDAKAMGMHYYDFLGIAPEDEPNHPWAGVTSFKLKFGGKRIQYLPAQEIIYKPAYFAAMKAVKSLKKSVKKV